MIRPARTLRTSLNGVAAAAIDSSIPRRLEQRDLLARQFLDAELLRIDGVTIDQGSRDSRRVPSATAASEPLKSGTDDRDLCGHLSPFGKPRTGQVWVASPAGTDAAAGLNCRKRFAALFSHGNCSTAMPATAPSRLPERDI